MMVRWLCGESLKDIENKGFVQFWVFRSSVADVVIQMDMFGHMFHMNVVDWVPACGSGRVEV